MYPATSERILPTGRIFYGAGIVGIGTQHFINGAFVPVILPSLPAGLALHGAAAYLGGISLLACGAAVIFGPQARRAALVLGWVLLAALVLRRIPVQLSAEQHVFVWNDALKLLTLSGGAFAVAASLPPANPGSDRVYTALGCLGMAVTMIVFGIEHFLYAGFVAMLVPAWIPGAAFWTYFCGAALVAAGLGLLLRILARTAAGLLGAMIFVWFIVLHIPRAVGQPYGPVGNEWTSVCEALSFSGSALILSQTLPRKAA